MQQIHDLRVIKTRNAIHQAFYEELAQTPFEAITVAGLASRAMIGKATFYNHYTDKYDLAKQLILTELSTLDRALISRVSEGGFDAVSDPLPEQYGDNIRHLKLMSTIHTPELDFTTVTKARFGETFRTIIQQCPVLLKHSDAVADNLTALAYSFFVTTINQAQPLDQTETREQMHEFFLTLSMLREAPPVTLD
ncbi:TetR/AcrR family transcriptional regulator [Lacticaseibacillus jixianensis]|uniref:TetR/AcrR family transcriptional regulator n=1 Tax=Lacticaseibacillus jixianensis TaxID=2486012 RepID=A0ABW4BCL7_9LACO|nr:TetR/AcrR family transcriptional regulator [Lacticaseibacillus jixianensis]